MLERYLKNAMKELDILIALIDEDIILIKEAKHERLSEKTQMKQHALVSFETTKSLLNHALLKKTQASDASLEESLNDVENRLLEEFKEKLVALKTVNMQYSKLLISVNEFYGTLFDRMFSFDSDGYQKTRPLPAAMLRVSA